MPAVSDTNPLEFFVNGEFIIEENVDVETKLVEYLRKKLLLTGTKIACGVGGCGSCTVILSKLNPETNKCSHNTVNACITPLGLLRGAHVLTVEGLGDASTGACTYLQDAIARGHGTQCGFCTPGMVMSMHSLFESNPTPDVETIKHSLNGNLCRCTGYRPILESFQKCSSYNSCHASGKEVDIEDCIGCKAALEQPRIVTKKPRIQFSEIEILLRKFDDGPAADLTPKTTSSWWSPTSLQELKSILNQHKNVTIVGGNTELFARELPEGSISNFVSLSGVQGLRMAEVTDEGVLLGAALSISEMITHLEKIIETESEDKTVIFVEVVKLMKQFGSEQIRNVATIGGSLKTSNVASDVQTFFHGFGCKAVELEFDSSQEDGALKLPVVTKLLIPFSNEFQSAWTHKVMRRAANDAAILNLAILIEQPSTSEFDTVSLCIGGTGVLESRVAKRSLPDDIKLFIIENIKPRDDKLYIESLGQNIWLKFAEWFSGKPGFERDERTFKSTQLFSLTPNGPNVPDLVGKPVPHASAHKHATGEAEFLDDISKYENELALAFILSDRAHAKILSIDTSRSAAVEGVVGFVFAEDLKSPDKNWFGLAVPDEEIFASTELHCIGQTIGGVLAKDAETARKAAALVEVKYEDLPAILTIEDAIKNESYYSDFGLTIENGDCSKVLESCPHILSGSLQIGGQAHFYMETQGCLGVPRKDGELELVSSSQYPTEVQHQVANKLDIPANRVIVKVRRIGGGFGGKETRCLLVALPVAVATQKFRRPVRCILDRKTDMLISGKRHPFEGFYTVGFDAEGRVLALVVKMYCSGGMSLDVSHAAIERILLNIENAYKIPNVDLNGFICKTNITSNTVFRGTGGPQAAIFAENLMDQVATYLGKDPIQIRRLNMYNAEGDVTHYGQTLYKCTVRQCWEECLQRSGYYARREAIEAYNKLHPHKKRGISMNPAHFGIAYTALFLNQATGIVHIYKDGSVLLNHGGVEIGQGIHSKMIQVATRELGIPATKIRIVETATDKVPNTTPTSASVSSDMNGMAIIAACRKLMKRLEPYKLDFANRTWEDVINKAYMDRVCLSATGFYKVPGIGWEDEAKRRGSPFNYFSTGAACTEVELDCLTGRYQILRTDIVMDVGESLNPAIDVGQIEGAFMQGVGLYTIEELLFSQQGGLETTGPANYKIPTVSDTPLEFNVAFLTGASNPRAIYSSKTVGEPPLLLATSVHLAIKDAVRSFRKANGLDANFTLHSPATVKKIMLACTQKDI